MIELGKMNRLQARRQTDHGWYLSDGSEEEVLLPNKFVPKDFREGQEIEVFVFNDSEDRITATTLKPKIQLHEFAWLKVVEVMKFGAFLDWGLEKDLLVPFAQQAIKMGKDRHYLVYLYIDEMTGRLAASTKLNFFLQKEPVTVKEGEEVDLLIGEMNDLGFTVIINGIHRGLIFKSDLLGPVRSGTRIKGFVKHIRPDHKIDVSLQKQGFGNVTDGAQRILAYLRANEGFLDLNDKSDPEEIVKRLNMSKKTFKRAIGGLYKRKMIKLEKEGVYLVK